MNIARWGGLVTAGLLGCGGAGDAELPDEGHEALALPAVNDGLGRDIDWQASTETLSANWSGFGEGGRLRYEWAIGTAPGLADVHPFTQVGTSPAATASGLQLAPGGTYFVTVETRIRGRVTAASSDGVRIDPTAPTAGTVSDGGGGPDVDVVPDQDALAASWSGFADPQSGVVGYFWSLGTTPGGSDVQGELAVGLATSGIAPVQTLPGVTYYSTIRAMNAAGASTIVVSDGVRVE